MAELDSLFAELRKEYEPDANARSRVRQRIGAAVAVGSALVVGSASAGASGVAASGVGAAAGASKALAGAGAAKVLTSSALTWTAAAKLSAMIGVGLAATIGGGVVFYELGASEAAISVSEASRASEVARAKGRGLSAPSALPKLRAEGPSFEGATALSNELGLADEPVPKEVAADGAGTAKPSHSSDVLEDLRLLQQASRALRAGNTAEARTLLAEHKRRFPRSVVQQERIGLGLLTRCSPEAGEGVRMEAERFLKAQPNSPLAEHVRKQCLP